MSCFSVHATKAFHTVEGGAACFRDAAFGQNLARLKNFGLDGPETVEGVGGNAKLDEFRSAMGLCNLRHVDGEIEKRGRVTARYRRHLEGVPGIQLRAVQEGVQTNYAYFPAVFDEAAFGADRDTVKAALEAQAIYPRKYIYPPTNTFPCYGGRFDPEKTPIAQRVSRQVLCLPIFADMEMELVDRICQLVLACRH